MSKVDDSSTSSIVAVRADAAGVTTHCEHVMGVMRRMKDNVRIPLAVVAEPVTTVTGVKCLTLL